MRKENLAYDGLLRPGLKWEFHVQQSLSFHMASLAMFSDLRALMQTLAAESLVIQGVLADLSGKTVLQMQDRLDDLYVGLQRKALNPDLFDDFRANLAGVRFHAIKADRAALEDSLRLSPVLQIEMSHLRKNTGLYLDAYNRTDGLLEEIKDLLQAAITDERDLQESCTNIARLVQERLDILQGACEMDQTVLDSFSAVKNLLAEELQKAIGHGQKQQEFRMSILRRDPS